MSPAQYPSSDKKSDACPFIVSDSEPKHERYVFGFYIRVKTYY